MYFKKGFDLGHLSCRGDAVCCVSGSKSITSSAVLLRALVLKGDIVKCDNILLRNDLIPMSLWGMVGGVVWWL